jgi:hypothetical protein
MNHDPTQVDLAYQTARRLAYTESAYDGEVADFFANWFCSHYAEDIANDLVGPAGLDYRWAWGEFLRLCGRAVETRR